MWTVRINGNPTIRCMDELTGLRAYEEAQHWTKQGHTVALWAGRKQLLPPVEEEETS